MCSTQEVARSQRARDPQLARLLQTDLNRHDARRVACCNPSQSCVAVAHTRAARFTALGEAPARRRRWAGRSLRRLRPPRTRRRAPAFYCDGNRWMGRNTWRNGGARGRGGSGDVTGVAARWAGGSPPHASCARFKAQAGSLPELCPYLEVRLCVPAQLRAFSFLHSPLLAVPKIRLAATAPEGLWRPAHTAVNWEVLGASEPGAVSRAGRLRWAASAPGAVEERPVGSVPLPRLAASHPVRVV